MVFVSILSIVVFSLASEICDEVLYAPSEKRIRKLKVASDDKVVSQVKGREIVFIPESHLDVRKRKVLAQQLRRFKRSGMQSLIFEFLPFDQVITQASDEEIKKQILRVKPNFPKKYKIQSYVKLAQAAIKAGLKVRGLAADHKRRKTIYDSFKRQKGVKLYASFWGHQIHKAVYPKPGSVAPALVLVGKAHTAPEYFGEGPQSSSMVLGSLARFSRVDPKKMLVLFLHVQPEGSSLAKRFLSPKVVRKLCDGGYRFFDLGHWYLSHQGSWPKSQPSSESKKDRGAK